MLYGNILVFCIQRSVTILFSVLAFTADRPGSLSHTASSQHRAAMCGSQAFPRDSRVFQKTRTAATVRRAVKSSKRVRLRECYQSYCGLCDLGFLRRLAMETGSNFWGFSISFSDARRLQGIEGGGEKEAYGAQPTPCKQANKHIHIATHVQMHSDVSRVQELECVSLCV